MKSEKTFIHQFVEFIPDDLEEAIIYISIDFATASHKCACGCGFEVVTPFTPTDWKLIFDGETISLDPSIGNWSFPCESHYWIVNNEIEWSRKWSKEKIEAGRIRDSVKKKEYIENRTVSVIDETSTIDKEQKVERKIIIWQKIKSWFYLWK